MGVVLVAVVVFEEEVMVVCWEELIVVVGYESRDLYHVGRCALTSCLKESGWIMTGFAQSTSVKDKWRDT